MWVDMVIFAISYKEIFPKCIYSVIYHMKTSGSHSTGKYSSAMRISPIIYFLISIGVSLQISGSNWDIVWHGVGNVETFFTPPHSVIYSGVALAIGSVIGGIIQVAFKIQQQKKYATWLVQLPSSLPLSLKLAAIGCILQLSAGPFDFLWHTQFGFDGLLSPPHSVLAVGMLTTALGALIGIYSHCSNHSSSNKINNTSSSSLFSKLSLIVGFAVFLMVAVGMILMFTLPFSKGQYFDFNPNPLAALVAASVSIPFILGICFFVAARISSFSTGNRIPFILTSIVAVIMTIQSTTTITSNSYFAWLFPVYLLNIIPALVADILMFRYSQKKKASSLSSKVDDTTDNKAKKWCLIASIIVSMFYITLFFPWTIDVFAGYFQPPNTLRTEQFFVQLLIPIILPCVVPASIVSSLLGGLVAQRLINSTKLTV